MPAGEYFEGAAFFLATLAATLSGCVLLLRRRYPRLTGVERVIAYGVLATGGVLAVHVVPAALGILGRGSVLAASVLLLFACTRVPVAVASASEPPAPDEAPPPSVTSGPVEDRISWWLAAAGVAVVGVFTLAFVRDQIITPSASIDFMNFHMAGVARWIESGSLWQVDTLLPFVAPGNYPNNGDVILLAGTLPWSNDFLAHLVMLPFLPLTGLAVYAVARRLGALAAPAAIAGALVVAIPVVAIPPLSHAIVDSVMLFTFAAGILFLLRHHRSAATSDLVLAGIALGIAFGTKWYGVSAVAIVVVVWIVARLVTGERTRTVLRQGGTVIGLVALAGGIWLLRNWIVSGNPVFPVKVAPLGITIFDAPPDMVREQAGFTILDYFGDWDAWDEFILPQFRRALAWPALLSLIGLLVAAVALGLRRPRAPWKGLLIAAAVCAVVEIAAYSITPYTAGGPEGAPVLVGADSRYVVPALLIAAAVAAWAAGAVRWGSAAFCALGLIAIVDGVSWAARGELSVATVDFRHWVFGVFAVAMIAAVAWVAWKLRSRLGASRWWVAVGGACAAIVLVATVAGNEIQERFNSTRYRGADPTIDLLLAEADGGHRIGIAGLWDDAGIAPPLPAFGTRLDNEVEYVGPLERELLGRHEDREEFLAALQEGDYDYLVVGRGRAPEPPPPDGRWARQAGFELVARSPRLDLYRRSSEATSTIRSRKSGVHISSAKPRRSAPEISALETPGR